MCGLFGFSSYGGDIKNCTGLTNALAEHSAVRGTDATGIAYLRNGNIQIQKEAKSAYALSFKVPDHTSALIGHTRHATHGAETVRGSFSFSILDDRNNVWLIKGDSPLSILHFPKKKIYVYANTDEILYKSCIDSFLFEELKKSRFEEIKIRAGDIMQIRSDGTIHADSFIFREASRPAWWEYGVYRDPVIADADEIYLDALRTTALWQGVDPEVIDELYASGFTLEEIEDAVYEI